MPRCPSCHDRRAWPRQPPPPLWSRWWQPWPSPVLWILRSNSHPPARQSSGVCWTYSDDVYQRNNWKKHFWKQSAKDEKMRLEWWSLQINDFTALTCTSSPADRKFGELSHLTLPDGIRTGMASQLGVWSSRRSGQAPALLALHFSEAPFHVALRSHCHPQLKWRY